MQHLTKRQSRRYEKKQRYRSFLDSLVCQICGHAKPHHIELHHLDPTQKEANVSRLINQCQSDVAIITEIEKCAALCSYCHKDVHKGLHDDKVLVSLKYIVDEECVSV